MDKPKTAVIAIHGVGEHKAGATAAQIAAQLQYFHPDEFRAFECTPVQIAVDAADLCILPTNEGKTLLPDSVRARARFAEPQGRCGRTDIAFTGVTLAGGEDYKAKYNTTRMRCGTRGFDLYEMFWADLSHGGTEGGLTTIRQMMQLLLHVACLGRTALSTLLAAHHAYRARPGLRHAYAAAAVGYWLLSVPIALGNLLLLCFGIAFLGLLVSSRPAPSVAIGLTIAAGAAVALAVAVASAALWRMAMREMKLAPSKERWTLRPVWLVTVICTVGGIVWYRDLTLPPKAVAFGLALALALACGTVVARRYDVSRPSALRWWCILLAACVLALFAAWPWTGFMNLESVLAVLAGADFVLLVFAWLCLTVINLILLGAGAWATFAGNTRKRNRKVARAVGTSLVAATVPTSLLLIVVLALWIGLSNWLETLDLPVVTAQILIPIVGKTTVCQFVEKLIDLSAGKAAMLFLAFQAVALTGLVVAIVPSVVAELSPPNQADPKGVARDDWSGRTRMLWRWLNGGFGLLAWAAAFAVVAFFLVLPAGAWAQYVGVGFPWLKYPDLGLNIGITAVLFVSVSRLFGALSIGKVTRALARMRVVVDTAIDVDNWLRERPVGNTPRLHIMARYTSLLRHLRNEGYERIVIVGHSQGTVITADLLRYLKVRNRAFLHDLGPIDLLTVGSPLRQLYAARFPALYGWIGTLSHTRAIQQAGVRTWTNGYGSGDYVGRNLWTGDWTTQPQPPDTPPLAADFCIGPLAHTHYFDEHAPDVAAAIRALIAAG